MKTKSKKSTVKWTTKTVNGKKELVLGDYTIRSAKGGEVILLHGKNELGTFPTVAAAQKAAKDDTAKTPKAELKPAAQPKEVAPKSAPRKGGKYPEIFGFSVCAVAKALGQAEIKWEEADKIMRAKGVEMPKASLSVQLGFGRRPQTWERHGKPAELTETQIAELRKDGRA